jgi:hypothetical protein
LRANSKGVLVSELDIIVDCFAILKQTKVQILSELKYPELRVIKRNKGLRGWFQFKILERGVLQGRNYSGEGKWSLYKLDVK